MSSNNTTSDPQTCKLLLLGDSGVGKSCLLLRFADDTFSDEHQSTIGVDYRFKLLSNAAQPPLKLMIWDTAGQERFRTLTSSYYRGAHGVILVYDVTRRQSFEDVEAVWVRELEAYIKMESVCLMLIGNKVDLSEERKVGTEEGRNLAKKLGALFMECSAKTKIGVIEAFEELVLRVASTPGILNPIRERNQTLLANSQLPSSYSSCSC